MIPMTGLDGGNLLAYLAALGTLRTLAMAMPGSEVRLAWEARDAWRPVLHVEPAIGPDECVVLLDAALRRGADNPAFAFADDLAVAPATFRRFVEPAANIASPKDRGAVDFAAAFGCEAVVGDEVIEDTAFRTMSGAGHQHFLGFMRQLASETTPDQLRSALFEPWRYDDPKPAMRWDPADDRRYALRWQEPSREEIRTVRGANRLAIEALPLFPTAPARRGLATTGFRGRSSRDTFVTWPIWEGALTCDAVRTAVALDALQASVPEKALLASRGVAQVFRSRRLTIGKYRNFSPARAL